DGQRGLDYLYARADVDPTRVIVVGHSLGGEIATYVGALDPRPAAVVVTGFSPDLGVIRYYTNHPCWEWTWADAREYIGVSDLHALIAPRPLIVETGRTDTFFSKLRTPYAGDKQVLRRSRSAFVDVPGHIVHLLHDSGHRFRVGDLDPAQPGVFGLAQPLYIE